LRLAVFAGHADTLNPKLLVSHWGNEIALLFCFSKLSDEKSDKSFGVNELDPSFSSPFYILNMASSHRVVEVQ